MKKLYIKTFGCQMNEYDSDKIVDILSHTEGTIKTDKLEDADIIVFNTCSVREKAQEKVFSDLGRLRQLKKARPELMIGVGGCVAAQEGDTIIKRAPFVDVVFGPQTLHRLPQLFHKRRASGAAQIDVSFPEVEKFDYFPSASTDGGSAFVSIIEGCSKYCSFCVVPYTRGEEVSRSVEGILTEVENLTQQGVKEVTLLGQNVNAYQGPIANQGKADLALLLEYIHEIESIERIRFTTSHPREFTDRLINCYATLPKLVSHLHLPVQSGSDRILAAMKRGYTVLEYKSIVRKLRAIRPDLCLTSDFIVGFPGETEADFNATLKLVQDLEFDTSFVFIYSPRPGTPAARLTDTTHHDEKVRRLKILNETIAIKALSISQTMIGSVERVMVEGVSKRDASQLAARTVNNRVVNFTGPARLIKQMVDVTITEAHPHCLKGEVVLMDTY